MNIDPIPSPCRDAFLPPIYTEACANEEPKWIQGEVKKNGAGAIYSYVYSRGYIYRSSSFDNVTHRNCHQKEEEKPSKKKKKKKKGQKTQKIRPLPLSRVAKIIKNKQKKNVRESM